MCMHWPAEIQVMMGSLVYLRLGLERSPYCHLLDSSHWAEICDTFTRDACSLLGLSVESPLSVRYLLGLRVQVRLSMLGEPECKGVSKCTWLSFPQVPVELGETVDFIGAGFWVRDLCSAGDGIGMTLWARPSPCTIFQISESWMTTLGSTAPTHHPHTQPRDSFF